MPSPFKIFVVEDDPWYSEWLSYNLTLNPDFEVVRFFSAKECLQNLHEQPQVITLDYSSMIFLYNPSSSIPVGRVNERNPLGHSGQRRLQLVVGSTEIATGNPE